MVHQKKMTLSKIEDDNGNDWGEPESAGSGENAEVNVDGTAATAEPALDDDTEEPLKARTRML